MPLLCPTDQEVSLSAAALRPRGDAWRNGGHEEIDGSVMGLFFDGIGHAAGPTHRRLCDLVEEFFCSTAFQTRDLWQLEYGLPDACSPFLDLCAKINIVGDSTTDYVAAAAASRGWVITIAEEWITNSQEGRAKHARAGAARCAARTGVKWIVSVLRDLSPSYTAIALTPPLAGRLRAGLKLNCDAGIDPLRCLVRLIAPAHADLEIVAV
jgi:hypothetical protein